MKLIIMFLLLAFFACNPRPASERVSETEAVQNSKQISDTMAMQQSVIGFLKWYKTNYTQANSFGFTYEDKQGNYHVSIFECEKFLNYLISSGFISDKYAKTWFKYFQDKAAYLEENPQNEGPPEGFEFDLVLITQEPEIVLNEVDNLSFTVIENNGNEAILQIDEQYGYDFEMIKENGKWKIQYIATMNYD